ncbi:MAG: TraR/DksA C4-type zinc finger protein [Candidatus Moranbacteria bacterium]|jgi:RNA polymerase-binding transcription factor DksA|nr:TraR/DksA C4-type zinc finger protein [Candidatus Moranbacteria bacterium]MDD5652515.1 TraR/DksA C4-type zinc finger protein [Candidatus Moranbacteria bacterium]MDX9855552.1 TraR/DksA C4-type zinc finger protein [Candidatus Moranbacteria bacterium]
MALTKSDLERFKKKLIDEKKRLEKELGVIARPDVSSNDNYKAVYEDMGTHKDENATEVEEYVGNVAVERMLEEQLQAVNNSLGKIKNGNYGICEVCGGEIRKERLEVHPSARRCMKCAG